MGFAKLLGIRVNRRRNQSTHVIFLVKKEEFNMYFMKCAF